MHSDGGSFKGGLPPASYVLSSDDIRGTLTHSGPAFQSTALMSIPCAVPEGGTGMQGTVLGSLLGTRILPDY